jgi:hypothetical protein
MFPPYRWHFGAAATQTTYAVTFNAALVRPCSSATRVWATN